jgi:hypothetical protein
LQGRTATVDTFLKNSSASVHGHVEHRGDAAPVPSAPFAADLQRLGAITLAVAVGQRRYTSEQELHLDMFEAISR